MMLPANGFLQRLSLYPLHERRSSGLTDKFIQNLVTVANCSGIRYCLQYADEIAIGLEITAKI